MAPPKSSGPKKGPSNTKKQAPAKDKKQPTKRQLPSSNNTNKTHNQRDRDTKKDQQQDDASQINLSSTIPTTLQQLLLNVFKSALLSHSPGTASTAHQEEQLDIKPLIQTIKSHLYNRDFDSAFTDANEELLRAYALRWSATRALGYAGIFKGVLRALPFFGTGSYSNSDSAKGQDGRIVCIGGGAGAEIVALAGVWRELVDGMKLSQSVDGLGEGVGAVSLNDDESKEEKTTAKKQAQIPNLAVTAVDIADWSSVVDRLSTTIQSPAVTGTRSHPAPLIPQKSEEDDSTKKNSAGFTVDFNRSDILTLPDDELKGLLLHQNMSTVMVTLMFTLNELFSTSMAKTTGFLLRMTDLLQPGTVLLVVDSPGSYSTLKLGKAKEAASAEEGAESKPQERSYPMKFLLDHTLLSVAAGKWDRIYSQDSRWWRRDAAKLGYEVGEGAGLEDMRFQVHIYRRLA
ncbi:hypothetical protein ASPWEDRAFT_183249 [Aspergillus wentii DTO 134E9]|uniref:25S rRNA (Uridine(2843)-N(3))-methyltransferase n=1 Tax=Aspergillus wentii DTO 134E9 TaxID=1073089 RepID=A0A1L9RJR6_ASPWE|nr:uncharacterized protein ASPWEDRAFT_183249 [Aspergillus wentii DTO 134E9]KAI9931902.1 hypothetical protein MW887_009403 [Aspergillus wentii]OJJ35141.1 hypothetical protein ASPWEDRAFT_183249 [Aspergillus wentii DTO 134E9]